MWFWLSLGSAVLAAVSIILNKKILNTVSPGLLSWALFALTIPILLIVTFFQGVPSINSMFFLGVTGSSLTYVFAKTIFSSQLKQGLISQIMPLTAFTGLFTYVFGLLILTETIRLIPVLGLLAIIIGSYILNADSAKEDLLKPFKMLFENKNAILLLIAIGLGGATVVFDKLGVINTFPQNPTFVMLTEQIIMTSLMTGYLIKKERDWTFKLKNNFRLLFLNSLIVLGIGYLVFYAYTGGPAALIIGVNRLQVFFALTLGYFIFKDKPTKHSWIATAVMIIGVLMIKLG